MSEPDRLEELTIRVLVVLLPHGERERTVTRVLLSLDAGRSTPWTVDLCGRVRAAIDRCAATTYLRGEERSKE